MKASDKEYCKKRLKEIIKLLEMYVKAPNIMNIAEPLEKEISFLKMFVIEIDGVEWVD